VLSQIAGAFLSFIVTPIGVNHYDAFVILVLNWKAMDQKVHDGYFNKLFCQKC
jgi:hypothetical protein